MTVTPLDVLRPVLHFLDSAIQDYGIYIHRLRVWLFPLVIIWILKSGFWRKTSPPQFIIVRPSELPPWPPKLPPADFSRN